MFILEMNDIPPRFRVPEHGMSNRKGGERDSKLYSKP
jgi:hypothetical protein